MKHPDSRAAYHTHMYYILLAPEIDRQTVLNELKQEGIGSVFHYIPLHSSPAGQRYGRTHGDLDVTNFQSERLVRLPLWVGIANEEIDRVIQTSGAFAAAAIAP